MLLSWVPLMAQAPPESKVVHHLPHLSSIFPQGSEPGQTLRLEVLGEFLDRASAVVFLDTSIRGRILESYPTRVELEFQVDLTVAFGPHYFRLVTPRGASNLLLFRVGDQPHRNEHEPNSSFEQAEEVPIPVTMNGQLNFYEDFDFYRFQVKKGETWIFDLRAARNGNLFDATMILLDANRRKLGHSEDYFDWDPFLTYTFSETGTYYLVVQPCHELAFDKFLDPNFAYQLDIRQAPHLQTISPLSLKPRSISEVTLFGEGLLSTDAKLWFDESGFKGDVLEMCGFYAHARIEIPEQVRKGQHHLALLTPGGRSTTATFLVDATPKHSSGAWIEPPVSITGIARYRQPERFFFWAKTNQSLLFEVRASRYGSPVDSLLRLVNEKGEEIARNDDGEFPGVPPNKDSSLSLTFVPAGNYELQMRNLWAVEGKNYPYQLLVRPLQPGAELMLDTDQPYVPVAGIGKLKVKAARQGGFEESIPLNVSGLPKGVAAEPAEIPAGKAEAVISFRAGDLKAGTYSQIRITSPRVEEPGWKTISLPRNGSNESAFARTNQVTLVVVERPRFSLEAALYSVTLVRGRSFELPVQIQREGDFQDKIRLECVNLPRGVTADPVFATPASKDVKILLRANSETPLQRTRNLVILGTARDGEVQEAPQITLTVE
jgi:hypothetical protein